MTFHQVSAYTLLINTRFNITNELEPSTSTLGSTVTITCSVDGVKERENIMWKKEGNAFHCSKERIKKTCIISTSTEPPNRLIGSLTLGELRESDIGKYTCFMIDTNGKTFEKHVNLPATPPRDKEPQMFNVLPILIPIIVVLVLLFFFWQYVSTQLLTTKRARVEDEEVVAIQSFAKILSHESQSELRESQIEVEESQNESQESQKEVQESQKEVQGSQNEVQELQKEVQGSQNEVQGSQNEVQGLQIEAQESQTKGQQSQKEV